MNFNFYTLFFFRFFLFCTFFLTLLLFFLFSTFAFFMIFKLSYILFSIDQLFYFSIVAAKVINRVSVAIMKKRSLYGTERKKKIRR
jgi:hypothetical protein